MTETWYTGFGIHITGRSSASSAEYSCAICGSVEAVIWLMSVSASGLSYCPAFHLVSLANTRSPVGYAGKYHDPAVPKKTSSHVQVVEPSTLQDCASVSTESSGLAS